MKKRKFRNPNLVLRRKRRYRLPAVTRQTDDEVYEQSLMLRRFAKRVTGSEYIRLDENDTVKIGKV